MNENFKPLPKGWSWVNLNELGELARGKSKHRPRNDPRLFGNTMPFLQTGEVARSNGIISDFSKMYSDFGVQQSRVFPKETVCITIAANIADTGILGFPACFPDSVVGLITDRQITDPYFIEYFLRTARDDISQYAPATAQANINLAILKKVYAPLPPLNEQHRIVAKIEALTARSRKARAALDAAKGYEKLLVAHYTSSRWEEKKLGDYIEEYKHFAGDKWQKYPVVGLSNEGIITTRKEPLGKKSAPKCKVVKTGCIVFNPIRFSIGSVARYRGEEDVIVSPEYQVIRTKDTLSAELLYRYLRSKAGQSRLENESQGSVRYRVYFKTLKELFIPIAPPKMQAQAENFLFTLNHLFSLADEVSLELDQFDQSILAKAFRGQLVPQDPNDEPASVLLERIRAEREKTQKKKGKGGKGKGKRVKGEG